MGSQVDGKLELKLVYPDAPRPLCDSDQTVETCSRENHWKQTSNPVETTMNPAEGYEPISIGFPGHRNGFAGLAYHGPKYNFLKGYAGSRNGFTIGNSKIYRFKGFQA